MSYLDWLTVYILSMGALALAAMILATWIERSSARRQRLTRPPDSDHSS